jgi:membrane dipeptidase
MMVDRRDGMALVAAGMISSVMTRSPSSPANDPIRGWTVINALGSINDPNHPVDDSDISQIILSPRMIADAHRSGETAVNITLGYVAGKQDPYRFTKTSIARWDELVRAHSVDLTKVLTTADILRARANGRIGIIYGFQNCAMLGHDPGRVDEFGDAGVRVFQLTYNPANQLGGGSMAPETMPLTPFGRDVIARLNERRLMVDLSHSGRQTCLDAIAASRAPISINHTGCRALVDLPRNKTDAELRGVAQGGGFVGIYFMPFLDSAGHATAAEVVAHIEHALKICGEDHVGIGTDGGTTPIDDLAAYAKVLEAEHADRVAKGVAAPGEGADTHPFVDDLRGPDQFRKLANLLAARGHTTGRIEKVLGGNFLRFAKEIWG